MNGNKIPIISTTKLEKVKNCNASNAKPEPRVNSGTLTRWGILNDAIGDWLNNDAPEETAVKKAENEHFVNFDDLQREYYPICLLTSEYFILEESRNRYRLSKQNSI